MRSWARKVDHISESCLAGKLARVGRCYHSSGIRNNIPIPINKDIDDETLVNVSLGIGRQFQIRVRQPPRPEASTPIIIFLRRGIPTATQNDYCIKDLAVGANAFAIDINYGPWTQNVYPAPIHTVLAGYDWARANLARGDTVYSKLKTTKKPSKIGVCGELVGGSLATMLALTECSYTPAEQEPQSISALAVGNPILDWTALTTSDATQNLPRGGNSRRSSSLPTGTNNDSLSANGLCDIRQAYFSKAETYFDPFASPLLFFHTPTSEISDEVAAPTKDGLSEGGLEDENVLLPPMKKRRSARKYPPMGSNLILPWTKVEVGRDCLLKDQGVDLVEMMRKSFKRSEAERPADATEAFERDFEVVEREGIGLWDEKHTLEVGHWFGEILRKP